MRAFYFILIAVTGLMVSCQKEISEDLGTTPGTGTPGTSAGKQCLLTKIVQGTGTTDDTVFLVKYDALNRIRTITIPEYDDSLVTTYTGSNKYPDLIEDGYGGGLSFSYNNAGRPLVVAGGGNKMEMEYVSDTVLSKGTSYYYDNTWKLSRRYTFQFDSKVNLASYREFSSANDLRGQFDITYTDILNPFNALVPYSFNNTLGMDDIFPADIFLYRSKYLVKSVSVNGQRYDVTYQQNSDHQVISSKAVYKDTGTGEIIFVATRSYFYTCP